ncbi:MAG: CHRD domain-containing protein [Verrucomicrobiota bacterium]
MRRPFPLVAAAIAAVGLFVAGLGLAASGTTSTKLSARLVAGSETPHPRGASRAAGVFSATLAGSSLSWRLTFSRLTGKALAAHVHLGRPGIAGPVAVPLCGPCVSGAHGRKNVTAKVRSALLSGGAYVNVHTARNPGGEIRGQVAGGPRPLPASTAESQPTTTDDNGGGYGGYGGYGG